jgi:hypothetical protein
MLIKSIILPVGAQFARDRMMQNLKRSQNREGRNMKNSRKLMPVIAFGLAFANAWATGIDKVAASQDCVEKVQTMFKGVWNPFARPPYRSVKTVYDSADKVLRVFDSIVQSPLRTISGTRDNGYFALVIDSNVWTGPSLEGPWSPSQGLPANRKEKVMRAHQFMIDGIQSAQCARTVVLDGKELEKYVYKVKTAPDKERGGLWLAAANIIYFDPAAERIVRWEMSEMQSSWAPQVSPTREVTVFNFDGEIKVDAPN